MSTVLSLYLHLLVSREAVTRNILDWLKGYCRGSIVLVWNVVPSWWISEPHYWPLYWLTYWQSIDTLNGWRTDKRGFSFHDRTVLCTYSRAYVLVVGWAALSLVLYVLYDALWYSVGRVGCCGGGCCFAVSANIEESNEESTYVIHTTWMDHGGHTRGVLSNRTVR